MSPSPDPAPAGRSFADDPAAESRSRGGRPSIGQPPAGRPSIGDPSADLSSTPHAATDDPPAGPPGGREPSDELFTALADGTRRRVLRAVADQGPVTATALAEAMPVSRQAVAKHLAVLRAAGLVVAERSGRETQFTAVSEPLDDLARWAEVAGRRWDDRLDRLRRRFG